MNRNSVKYKSNYHFHYIILTYFLIFCFCNYFSSFLQVFSSFLFYLSLLFSSTLKHKQQHLFMTSAHQIHSNNHNLSLSFLILCSVISFHIFRWTRLSTLFTFSVFPSKSARNDLTTILS